MKSITLALALLFSIEILAKVQLPPYLSDGIIFQREQTITLWGNADKGETISVSFAKTKNMPKTIEGKKLTQVFQTTANADGYWTLDLPSLRYGGPYTLNIGDVELNDVLIGDVWLCSGQSNMELPVRRVMDKYADEIETAVEPNIRMFLVKRVTEYISPRADVEGDGWKSLNKTNAYEFSAVAYFFAQERYAQTGIPQGVVEAAVGGTPIEAWLSREALVDYPYQLAQLEVNANDDYRANVESYGFTVGNRWESVLADKEKSLNLDWLNPNFDDKSWEMIDVFDQNKWAFDKTGVLNGVHWFRREVILTAEQAAQNATLRLGCLVDADQVYVNGTFVGTTGYQYPPRIYSIKNGILHEGRNVICIRLESQNGPARFVPEKYHGIFFGDNPWLCGTHTDKIDLDGSWRHFYAARLQAKQGIPFFYYTPTVLYNGMLAPLAPAHFAGAIWYQGESNISRSFEYKDMLKRLMQCWRTTFSQPEMKFVIVEMADFERPLGKGWIAVQQAQREAADEDPNAFCASAKDLGEWNDIHPLNKKDLAKRIAQQLK